MCLQEKAEEEGKTDLAIAICDSWGPKGCSVFPTTDLSVPPKLALESWETLWSCFSFGIECWRRRGGGKKVLLRSPAQRGVLHWESGRLLVAHPWFSIIYCGLNMLVSCIYKWSRCLPASTTPLMGAVKQDVKRNSINKLFFSWRSPPPIIYFPFLYYALVYGKDELQG